MRRFEITLHDVGNSLRGEVVYTQPCLEKLCQRNKFNIPVTCFVDGVEMVMGYVHKVEMHGPDISMYVQIDKDNLLTGVQYYIIPLFIVNELQYLENNLVAMISADIVKCDIKMHDCGYLYQVEEV